VYGVQQDAWRRLVATNTKLVIYRGLKNELRFEPFLDGPVRQDWAIKIKAKLRAGAHGLAVESGRFEGLQRAERECPLCKSGAVEDEAHFLLDCPWWQKEREEMWWRVREVLVGCGLVGVQWWLQVLGLGREERLWLVLGGVGKVGRVGLAGLVGTGVAEVVERVVLLAVASAYKRRGAFLVSL
jgi:hypothetical protein